MADDANSGEQLNLYPSSIPPLQCAGTGETSLRFDEGILGAYHACRLLRLAIIRYGCTLDSIFPE